MVSEDRGKDFIPRQNSCNDCEENFLNEPRSNPEKLSGVSLVAPTQGDRKMKRSLLPFRQKCSIVHSAERILPLPESRLGEITETQNQTHQSFTRAEIYLLKGGSPDEQKSAESRDAAL